MPITNLIRDNWCRFQGELFPEIQDAVGPLLKNHQRLVMALGIICPEDFTLSSTLYKIVHVHTSTSRKFRMWRFRPVLAQGENDSSEVPTISLLVATSDEGLWK